jgi:general secretion pathway protein L
MAQRIVGIDLGTSSIKVVVIAPKGRTGTLRNQPSRGSASYDVVTSGEVEVPPPGPDQDVAGSLRERQGEALAELKQRGLLDGDLFVVGLPGDAAAIKMLHFPFNDPDKIATALPYALESEIALDIDEVVYASTSVGPEGAKDANVMCAYARQEAVQEVLDTMAVVGIDPRHVELDALALGHLWELVLVPHELEPSSDLRTTGGTVIETTEGGPQPAMAIVDIGHRRTSVCIVHQGRVVSAHTLLHGGADATRALAREIGLSLDEAERGKRKEAFLEVAGADAQFPEQKHISDVLKTAYAPLVRRLRQIVQATLSSSRLRVVKIVLTGGGGRIVNLDRYVGEELNIRVSRASQLSTLLNPGITSVGHDVDGRMEMAQALAYAISGLLGPRSPLRLDFRVGRFAWKGDYEFLRERLPALGAWAAALLLVVGVGSLAQLVMLSRETDALIAKQLAVCESITGEKIESTSRCTSIIGERIKGTVGFQVPEVSAVDVFMEVSRRLPYSTELKRKITELDITAERVRLKGTTTSYEAIDTMVERLSGGRCFHLVEKGKARNINADSVEMNITINLDCAAAPGDGKAIAPPPAPTAASLAEQSSSSSSSSSASSASSTSSTSSLAPRPPPTGAPPPSPPPAEAGVDAPAINKSSPEQIEARRERLRQLREERAARRRQLLDTPQNPLSIRDRLERTVPQTANEGDE